MSTYDFVRKLDCPDGMRWYRGIKTDHEGNEHTVWQWPSVTTVLDKAYPTDSYLLKYLREQGLGGQAIFERAGDEGTEVHIAIESIVYGRPVATALLSDKVKKCIQAFISWAEAVKPKFLILEEQIQCGILRVAGTRDLLCEINGEKWLVDFKTSNTVHRKHYLQVAAYWEIDGNRDVKTAILHLGNTTKKGYSFLEFNPMPEVAAFLHVRKMFDIVYPDAKPNIKEYPEEFKLSKELTIKP